MQKNMCNKILSKKFEILESIWEITCEGKTIVQGRVIEIIREN